MSLADESARRDDVGAAENRQDVVDALRVKGVQEHKLQLDGDVDLRQVVADLEVGDRARLDPVGVEVRPAVDVDVGRGERVVRVLEKLGRVGIGHETRVVTDIASEPEAGLPDVVVDAGLDLQLLVVVDEKRRAGDRVDGTLIEEEAAGRRRVVDRVDVAGGHESPEPRRRRQIEAQVPALVLAAREGDRKDDPGRQELVLVAGILERLHQ